MLTITAVFRPGRALRWAGLLLVGISIAAPAQVFNPGVLIPEVGSVPDLPVETDFILPEGYPLRDSVDNSRWCPPPGYQGRQASCTTWALCYGAMSYWGNRAAGRTYMPSDTLDEANTYSPALLFDLLKQQNDAPCSTGVNFREIIRLAMDHGVCSWEQFPYDTTLNACLTPAPARVLRSAKNSLRPELQDIEMTDPQQWKFNIDQGRPIIAEIVTDSTFLDSGWATGGQRMFHWRYAGDERLIGGHAVVCTGYYGDSLFTFMNSYGTAWGGHGYFTATWDILKRRCTGAHVLMNDSSGLATLLSLSDAVEDTLRGGIPRKRIEQGKAFWKGGALIRLTGLDPNERHASVQLFQPSEKVLLHTLHMRDGQTYAVYGDGQRTVYTYHRASILGRWLKRPVRFTVTTTNDSADPYLARRDALLRKLHKGLGH